MFVCLLFPPSTPLSFSVGFTLTPYSRSDSFFTKVLQLPTLTFSGSRDLGSLLMALPLFLSTKEAMTSMPISHLSIQRAQFVQAFPPNPMPFGKLSVAFGLHQLISPFSQTLALS